MVKSKNSKLILKKEWLPIPFQDKMELVTHDKGLKSGGKTPKIQTLFSRLVPKYFSIIIGRFEAFGN